MACVEKIKHDVPHCTSSKDSLQVFHNAETGKFSGFCFSCSGKGLEAYITDPYNGKEPKPPKKKTEDEINEEIQEIRNLKPSPNAYRGIEPKYFSNSGTKLALSEYDGVTPWTFNFPYTVDGKLRGYKVILLNKINGEKVMWSVGDIKNADLFNWEIAKKNANGPKPRLYVTEGEWDCRALEQMLEAHAAKRKSPYNKFAVTSLPHGVKSAVATLGRMRKEIDKFFTEIVLVFDNDEAGKKAVRDVQKILPDIKVAVYPTSAVDANEVLLKGDGDLFADFCIWKSTKPVSEGVVNVSTVLSRSMEPPQMGLSYPWPELTDMVYGQRFGEATCLGAGIGVGKCQGKDTPILMYNGEIKAVQDVVVGDLLMGDDSTSRTVRSTVTGHDEMFKVTPVKGEAYTFNREHILAVYVTNANDRKYLMDADGVKHSVGEKSTVTVDTYLRSSAKFKANCKLYRTAINFTVSDDVLPIPPYILGAWLGDGTTDGSSLTTADPAIKEVWMAWGESLGCATRIVQGSNCETLFLSTERGKPNPALEALRELGVIGNKHIPQAYMVASKEERLQLLAGILDTDGHLAQGCFDLVLKQKVLSEQVAFVARSLGMATQVKEATKSIKSLGFTGTYYRQCISGDIELIPTKLKKAGARHQVKDVLVTGFTVDPVGKGDYYGFDITGNRLYVLGDFTVTHNTLIAHETGAHNIITHNEKVFMVLLEEDNRSTLWNVAGKIDSLAYHRPEIAKDNWEQFTETARSLEGKLFLWESDGHTSSRFDIEEILRAVRFNTMEFGVRFHVIDNITRLVDHLPSGEANEFINRYSSEIANLCSELDIHIDMFSHLNTPKGQGARDHESGGEVLASQFTGSRGIMRSFPLLMGFERNKMAEDGKASNSYISCIKNRKFGGEGRIKTQYQPNGRLLNLNWEGDSLY